ncbi:MAG: VOC family protein [Deltaproteobacteria bacterium]|nr:VOC family protein [Deltaproteobacteria bacterium]
MKPWISLITLGVRDLGRSIRFYEEGLRLPRMPFEDGVAFFRLHGTWLALYPWDALAGDAGVEAKGSGFRGVTLAQNRRTREEVDEVLREAVRAGGTLVKPGEDTFWGGYTGYFADPDGHLWEIAWNPQFWPGPGGDEP